MAQLVKEASSDSISKIEEKNIQSGQVRGSDSSPRLIWDSGTAYDFFISLSVLQEPDEYGLRASWAAGVRSRLNTDDRKILLSGQRVFGPPLYWVQRLAQPKNATNALWALRQVTPEKRLFELAIAPGINNEIVEIYQDVARKGTFDDSDMEDFRQAYRDFHARLGKHIKIPNPKVLSNILDTWTDATGFGEKYLTALENYYSVFFAEEEKHILPALENKLVEAQELAARLSFDELFEKLSQGLRMERFFEMDELVLAPSYWCSPLVNFELLGQKKMLMTFGARPADESLVPGEDIPDALLQGLKAVSDPTRLKILKLIAKKPMAPAELARQLRLRAPTVTHHLRALRLAGLVRLTVAAEGEGRYTVRSEALSQLNFQLSNFVGSRAIEIATD